MKQKVKRRGIIAALLGLTAGFYRSVLRAQGPSHPSTVCPLCSGLIDTSIAQQVNLGIPYSLDMTSWGKPNSYYLEVTYKDRRVRLTAEEIMDALENR